MQVNARDLQILSKIVGYCGKRHTGTEGILPAFCRSTGLFIVHFVLLPTV